MEALLYVQVVMGKRDLGKILDITLEAEVNLGLIVAHVEALGNVGYAMVQVGYNTIKT